MALDMSKKYGPLPLWGWASLGVAGVGGLILYRRKKVAAIPAPTSGVSNPVTSGAAGSGLSTAQYIPTGNTSYYVDTVPQSSASDTQSQAFQAQVAQQLAANISKFGEHAQNLGKYEQYIIDEPALAKKYQTAGQAAAEQHNYGAGIAAINQEISMLTNPSAYSAAQSQALGNA